MPHQAQVIAHSVSPWGHEIVTLEVEMPRIVLAEFNTHRVFSRNSASSRAIPVKVMLQKVIEHPYIPMRWDKNQKGMQARAVVDARTAAQAEVEWLKARDSAVDHVTKLLGMEIHKQLTNRLLEPFLWHTVIVTTTELSNFSHLRNNDAAHPDIHKCAALMDEAIQASTAQELQFGEWHLPYIFEQDLDEGFSMLELVKISSARCARVSYLTHDKRRAPQEDLGLHERLLDPGHMSPFEHPARPMTEEELNKHERIETALPFDSLSPAPTCARTTFFCGNFNGFVQYRKTITGEYDIHGFRKEQEA